MDRFHCETRTAQSVLNSKNHCKRAEGAEPKKIGLRLIPAHPTSGGKRGVNNHSLNKGTRPKWVVIPLAQTFTSRVHVKVAGKTSPASGRPGRVAERLILEPMARKLKFIGRR